MSEKLIFTANSLEHSQRDYTDLQLVLNQIFQQVSSFDHGLGMDSSSMVTSILVQKVSACFEKCNAQDHFLSSSLPSVDEFSCQKCRELLFKPVTLLCGHTFCYSCLYDQCMPNCLVCGAVVSEEKCDLHSVNILMSKVLQKWHPSETMGRELFAAAVHLLKQGQCHEAVEVLTNALVCTPKSHTVLLRRAEAQLLLGDLNNALKDAHKAVLLTHKWSKAHFVKAEIHYKLHSYDEALFSYLMALVLDSKNSSARQRIVSILNKMVTSTNRHQHHKQDGKRGTKRRATQDSPVPRKHSFCRWSVGSGYSGGEQLTQSRLHSTPCLLKPQPEVTSSKANLTNSGTYSSSATPCFSLLPETDRAMDRILLTYFTTNYGHSSKSDTTRQVDPLRIDPSDFECSLCYRLLYNPVCTPCGHMFCQFCIERSLDHGTKCPLCKQSIEDSLAKQLERLHPNIDYITNTIVKRYLSKEYTERELQHKEEIEELNQQQPVFVCTLAFPSVPCPLHIFEPRYRLMLRRCLEFNKREFGMCMPDESGRPLQTGTLLKVRNVTYFPDGRSVVDSSGVRRFKTIDCHIKDGYNVAKLDFIVDQPVKDPFATTELSSKVYNMARTWFQSLQSNLSERIVQHFGTFPELQQSFNTDNGPDWHWWVLAVMPVEDRVKVTILSKNSYHERLLIMHRIFLCLQKRSENARRKVSPSS